MYDLSSEFKGPLFISGMPRSGTKLLRDLVNNHPLISIPTHESHFIPWMLRNIGKDTDLNQASHLEAAIALFLETKFAGNYPQKLSRITAENIKAFQNPVSWASFFEYIFRELAEESETERFIWGDKTPGYILHYELLKSIFPTARFVHIIRDPRDYALSVNHAWGRSMERAAHRWHQTIHQVRQLAQHNDDYLEVRYEDLLDDPVKVLTKICRFAGTDYELGMELLRKPSENLGETKGKTAIIATNKNKFMERIPADKLKRIEELVCYEAEQLSYQMVNNVKHKPLNSNELFWLKVYDGFQSATFHIKSRGFAKGINYFLKLHKQGSWRGV